MPNCIECFHINKRALVTQHLLGRLCQAPAGPDFLQIRAARSEQASPWPGCWLQLLGSTPPPHTKSSVAYCFS